MPGNLSRIYCTMTSTPPCLLGTFSFEAAKCSWQRRRAAPTSSRVKMCPRRLLSPAASNLRKNSWASSRLAQRRMTCSKITFTFCFFSSASAASAQVVWHNFVASSTSPRVIFLPRTSRPAPASARNQPKNFFAASIDELFLRMWSARNRAFEFESEPEAATASSGFASTAAPATTGRLADIVGAALAAARLAPLMPICSGRRPAPASRHHRTAELQTAPTQGVREA
mmetsp:Transcript_102005/g.327273  ORF Transcript_102005/g.327273 Transcript_102005/m.327273 type:complete len:227 (-) Transcript_102005:18-698(-)